MADNISLSINKIQRNRVIIHCCTSPDDGERVNAQIVETENKLVIVDTMLMRQHARDLRAYADSLNKPIDRVYLSHAHPDHWFGMEFFQDCDIYSHPGTVEEIKIVGQFAVDYHNNLHKGLTTDQLFLPNRVAGAGDVQIDGVTFRIHEVLTAEDLFMLVIELPEEKTLIAQDLVYNKVHLFVGQKAQDGTLCFDGWLAALKEYQKGGYELVIPGHGVPTDTSVFAENIRYLEIMKKIASTSNRENFVQTTLETFPDYELKSMAEMSATLLYLDIGDMK